MNHSVGGFRLGLQATRDWKGGGRVCLAPCPGKGGPAVPKVIDVGERGWVRGLGAGRLKGGTYRKDFMSKPRFRICPTTWSQLPGLERLRPAAARYLEPAEAPCRAWPLP